MSNLKDRQVIVIDFAKTVDTNGKVVDTTPDQQEHYSNKLKQLLVVEGYFDHLSDDIDGSCPSIEHMEITLKDPS